MSKKTNKKSQRSKIKNVVKSNVVKNNEKTNIVTSGYSQVEVEKEKPINICIGIPHTGLFHWQVLTALLSLKFPKNCRLTYHMIGSSLVYEARESIGNFAIKNNVDYCVFLDSDMVPPNDMINKMLHALETHPEVGLITGMAFKRIPPFQPCFYTKLGYNTKTMQPILESPLKFPKEGMLEIQGCGMACCMVRTSVFKEIEKPWFFPMPNLGEDLTFCIKAKHKKIRMLVDLSIDVGHVATMPIHADHFITCRDEHEKLDNGKPLFEEVKE